MDEKKVVKYEKPNNMIRLESYSKPPKRHMKVFGLGLMVGIIGLSLMVNNIHPGRITLLIGLFIMYFGLTKH